MNAIPSRVDCPVRLNRTGRHRATAQRGAGALPVILLLVFACSIALFHLQRGAVVEQRSSVNHARAVAAGQLAEAGLAWAGGVLNSPLSIGADCRPDGGGSGSFRQRVVEGLLAAQASSKASTPAAGTGMGTTGSVSTAPTATFRCTFIDELPAADGSRPLGHGLRCDCPVAQAEPATATAAASTATGPGFVVTLSLVPVAPEGAEASTPGVTLQVISVGCPHGCGADIATPSPAQSADTTPQGEGRLAITALLRHVPSLRWAPAAALTCAGNCSVEATASVTSMDISTGGLTVLSGGTTSIASGAALHTLPGQPVAAAIAALDAPLAALRAADAQCQASAAFAHFFGMTLPRFLAASPEVVKVDGCIDRASCGTALTAALRAGWRTLYLPHGLHWDGSASTGSQAALGAAGDGVRLIVDGPVRVSTPLTVNGLVFLQQPQVDAASLGPLTVEGAVVGCGDVALGAGAAVRYSPATLGARSLRHGVFARVPGSWRDF